MSGPKLNKHLTKGQYQSPWYIRNVECIKEGTGDEKGKGFLKGQIPFQHMSRS